MSIESLKRILFPSLFPEELYLSLSRPIFTFPHEHEASLKDGEFVLTHVTSQGSKTSLKHNFILKKISQISLLREYLESE